MKKTIVAILLVTTIFACKKTKTFDCNGTTPTYTNSVKTIMDNNCAKSGCHVGSNPAKGIDLSTYEKVKSASSNSNFLGSINHSSGYDAMPQSTSKLDDASIKTLTCWIENGTL